MTANEPLYIGRNSDRFPRRLLQMPDPPKGLYVIGELPLDDRPSVAIVGARMCSPYGHRIACSLGMELAARGVQVVSGMALGIDGYAHEGALSARGKTFAVLGNGVDICYPEKNRRLYRDIPQHGGLISEVEPGTPPLPYNFPKRNRIISALADIVIVVEARKKSGSLITADCALEQGRTVMAVPGRIGDALAEGPNYLIAQGAEIAWSVEAVLEALLPLSHPPRTKLFSSPANAKGMGSGEPGEAGGSYEQLSLPLGGDGDGPEKALSPRTDTENDEERLAREAGKTGPARAMGTGKALPPRTDMENDEERLAREAGKTGPAGAMGTGKALSPRSAMENDEERLARILRDSGISALAKEVCRLLGSDGRTFDEIAEELPASVSEISSALLELCLLGFAREVPGGRYLLTGR